MTYGTSRVNAYKILEDSLNLKDTRVYDTIEEDGKEKEFLIKGNHDCKPEAGSDKGSI